MFFEGSETLFDGFHFVKGDGLLLVLLCGDCIALRRCRCSPLDMDDDARKADEDGRAAADSSRVRGR